MKVIRPRSYQGILTALADIRNQYGVYKDTLPDGKIFSNEVELLYRGQSDAAWRIDTTLERATQEELDVGSYMARAQEASYKIESFTGKDWKLSQLPELLESIKSSKDQFRLPLPHYDYLVYLRHHGFPSPLLDWTRSPLVALYFAYATAGTKNPALYCYIERPKLSKGGIGGDARIEVIGHYVRTHVRHHVQQAQYTVCSRWDHKRQTHVFTHHENVFQRNDETQDLLFKIILPISHRTEALRRLQEANINWFTLYNSEDSLVKTVAMDLFEGIR